MRRLHALSMALLLAASITLAGCGGAEEPVAASSDTTTTKKGPEVRVGSFLDAEGAVLGSMIIQMLEANGIQTVDKTKLGTPDVVRKALLEKQIDIQID